jgi:hypothetical protein
MLVSSRALWVLLDNAPAPAEQLKDQYYRRNNKQQMNQTTTHTADQSEQPQDQENNQNCPKHNFTSPKTGPKVSSAQDLRLDYNQMLCL